MDRDELTRQLESLAGTLQYQVLNNLDDLVAPVVQEGKVSKDALELTVKKPLMRVVTRLRSLRLTTQNPGFERQKETSQ
jgi:hypothetical protein